MKTAIRWAITAGLVAYSIYNLNKDDVFAGMALMMAAAFTSPLVIKIVKSAKACTIIAVISLVIGLIAQADSAGPKHLTQSYAEINASRYVKNNYLDDKTSYQELEYSQLQKDSTEKGIKYTIWHSFRAKNKLGMSVYKKLAFFMDKDGNVESFIELE